MVAVQCVMQVCALLRLPVPLLGLTVGTFSRSALAVGEWILQVGLMLSPSAVIGWILLGFLPGATLLLLAAQYTNLAALQFLAERNAGGL